MRSTVRSWVVTLAVVLVAGAAWFYLAPTQIGGSTTYLVTHGVSMEPLLHTDDLALVRPASNYRVGQVVAYHSALLHTVVLHRIIGREGSRYLFKGDNNDFADPEPPTRSQLIGRMWLRIPNGGVVLKWVQTPWVAAMLTGGAAMLLLLGTEGKRRRRDQRRQHHRRPTWTTTEQRVGEALTHGSFRLRSGVVLAACTVAAALAATSVIALMRPTTETVSARIPYVQHVSFSYRAHARAGPVYPTGIVSTGQPIYVQLVHRVRMTATYRLKSAAVHRVHGTVQLFGRLANTTGWKRTISLSSPVRFVGDRARASADIDVSKFESLANRIATLTGDGAGGSYTLAIIPTVKLAGELAGRRLLTGFRPSLVLTLGAPQLLSGIPAAASTGVPAAVPGSTGATAQQGLSRSNSGAVTSFRTVASTLVGIPVGTVRWLAPAALVLVAAIALLTRLGGPRKDPDPAEQINNRYKRLIVPVSGVARDPDHPPIEVTSMEALAQLAQRSERLILHDHRDNVDSYMIDDQGTMFRYRQLRVTDTRKHHNGAGNHAEGASNGAVSPEVPDSESLVTAQPASSLAPTGVQLAGAALSPSVSAEPTLPEDLDLTQSQIAETELVQVDDPDAALLPLAEPELVQVDDPDAALLPLAEPELVQVDDPDAALLPLAEPEAARQGPDPVRPSQTFAGDHRPHFVHTAPDRGRQLRRAALPLAVTLVVLRHLRARRG